MIKYLLPLGLLLLLFACQTPSSSSQPSYEEWTVAQIHEAFQTGSLSAEELVNYYVDRIQRLDGKTNAISILNPKALSRARQLDQEFKETGTLRPLHGIPIIVKDNINTAGMPTTAGSLALANYVPKEDAFIIRRLKEAGAILLAKSNMAEWAFSPMHSESSTVGTTRNPYNLAHVPAGSSGGSGAAVAANFASLSLGTDTGNSIRGPSSHNSLVGFRTTLGLVSRSAIVPLYLRNDVVGPMCRTVEDATRMLEVIAGFDPEDPITQYAEGKIPMGYTRFLQKDGLQGARIGVFRTLAGKDGDPEILSLFEQAIEDLKRLGAEVVDPLVVPGFDTLSQDQWCSEFRKDLEAFLAEFVQEDSLQSLEDVIRVGTHSDFARMRLNYFTESEGRRGQPELPCLNAYEDLRRIAFREGMERVMDSLELDALVYPSWRFQPALIDSFQVQYKGDNSQIISPHTGQPAFTVPMGFTQKNLPAGLQFLGRMYDEPVLIRLTYAYEQGTLHRKPPQLDE